MFDAIVIGGGFCGCEVALAMRRAGIRRVAVVEREAGLMRRASFVNQARVHNGYHYPRSLSTAKRCRSNFVRFCAEYRFAIHGGTRMLYAIARDSRVDPTQFERFCRAIGASYRPLGRNRSRYFDVALILEAYWVEEVTFDADALARNVAGRAGISVYLNARAEVTGMHPDCVHVRIGGDVLEAGQVINCTYASLDSVGIAISTPIKRELTEIALIEPPRQLQGLGVTVMDGPYFSSMPFPALGCHSLTHVRYTPHAAWNDALPAEVGFRAANAAFMLRDGARHVPSLANATYLRSIFEIKAVLAVSEESDARPILVERSETSPRVVSILGAKIDNIFDVIEHLETIDWGMGA